MKTTHNINWTIPLSVAAVSVVGLGVWLVSRIPTQADPEQQPGKVIGPLAPNLFKRSPEWHRTTAQYLYDVMNEKLDMDGWNDTALMLLLQCGQEDFKAVFNAFGIRPRTVFGFTVWKGNLVYWLRKVLADGDFYQRNRTAVYDRLRQHFAPTRLFL